MKALRYLGIAVAYRRVGVVILDQGKLRHWQISTVAYDSSGRMSEFTEHVIKAHRPTVIVTQKLDRHCRKGPNAQALIAVIGEVATRARILQVETDRQHDFTNKYQEAEALVGRYPDLEPWLPRRDKFYDNEPRNTVLFEALAMADKVMRGSTTTLAAALG